MKAVKGSAFEKAICVKLSLWWTDDERDDIFYRTSGSGSRFTTRKKQGKDTTNSAGDVGYLDSIGEPLISNYVIEIKRGYNKTLSVLDFIDKLKGQEKPQLYKWWEKAVKEKEEAHRKDIMIIMKRDYKRVVVCLKTQTFNKLKDWHGRDIGNNQLSVQKGYCYLTIIRWEDFMTYISPKSIIEVQK